MCDLAAVGGVEDDLQSQFQMASTAQFPLRPTYRMERELPGIVEVLGVVADAHALESGSRDVDDARAAYLIPELRGRPAPRLDDAEDFEHAQADGALAAALGVGPVDARVAPERGLATDPARRSP
jgi:hypothetical protein